MTEPEQGVVGAERLSVALPGMPLSDLQRARCLAVAFNRAENRIGHPPAGCSLRERAKFLLERARQHGLDARDYEILYFVYRTTTKAAAQ